MSSIRLDIVTVERMVYSDDVDMVIAPGVEGQLGLLPHHTPLMTALAAGELRAKKGTEEIHLAISGGFLEVRPDRVLVLADAAERAEEIDIERAEKAKKRAEQRVVEKRTAGVDASQAQAALIRSMARLNVAEKMRKRKKMRA